jgi:hypothetical protein
MERVSLGSRGVSEKIYRPDIREIMLGRVHEDWALAF